MPGLLLGESRAVEYARFDDEWQIFRCVGKGGTDIAHIAYLLGNERTVGEILGVRRPVGVDGEGHAHLSHRNGAPVHGLEPGKGILHFDFPFLREVNLGLVLGIAGHVAREAEACVAYLEAAGVDLGLVLVLAADGAVDFGQVFLDFPERCAVGCVPSPGEEGGGEQCERSFHAGIGG